MKVITTNLLNRFWTNGIKPIKAAIENKLDISKIIASENITEPGYVMDGKTTADLIAELNSKSTWKLYGSFQGSGTLNVSELMTKINAGEVSEILYVITYPYSPDYTYVVSELQIAQQKTYLGGICKSFYYDPNYYGKVQICTGSDTIGFVSGWTHTKYTTTTITLSDRYKCSVYYR